MRKMEEWWDPDVGDTVSNGAGPPRGYIPFPSHPSGCRVWASQVGGAGLLAWLGHHTESGIACVVTGTICVYVNGSEFDLFTFQ
jgi:hypothetical protein